MKVKSFYKTYPISWDKLDDSQRRKTEDFWVSILSCEGRNKVQAAIYAFVSAAEKEQKIKEAVTTVDDLAKLLHVRFDVSLVSLWTEVLTPKKRAELDDHQRDGLRDPWDEIAGSCGKRYLSAPRVPEVSALTCGKLCSDLR